MNDFGSPEGCRRRSILIEWFFKRGGYKTRIVFFLCSGILLGSMIFSAASGRAESTTDANVDMVAPSGMFFVGERLEYEVSYSIFALGTVKVEIVDTAQRNGQAPS